MVACGYQTFFNFLRKSELFRNRTGKPQGYRILSFLLGTNISRDFRI